MPDRHVSSTTVITSSSITSSQHTGISSAGHSGAPGVDDGDRRRDSPDDGEPVDEADRRQEVEELGAGKHKTEVPLGRDTAVPNGIGDSRDHAHAINPLGLHLLSDPERGRGVFTNKPIPAGTLIEESPVLLLTAEQWNVGQLQQTILGEYGFTWSNGGQAVGLGLASLFNHSSAPNVNFVRQPLSSTIRFTAARRIESGEELCICYSADESKLWFTPTGQAATGSQRHSESAEDTPDTTALSLFSSLRAEDLLDMDLVQERAARLEQREARKRDMIQTTRRKRKSFRKTNPLDTTGDVVDGMTGPGFQSVTNSNSSLVSRSGSVSPSSSSNSSSYPVYPSIPSGPPLDLPAPLHSMPRASPSPALGTVALCPDLPWSASDWSLPGTQPRGPDDWVDMVRIKGPTELEEDAAQEASIDVWVSTIDDAQTVRLILDYTKDQIPQDVGMKHLKRIAKRSHPVTGEPNCTMVVLRRVADISLDDLKASLTAYHPLLGSLAPFVHSVPASPARTPTQLALRSPSWPISYAPGSAKPPDSTGWSAPRRAWVAAGIARIIALARSAATAGELPVGVYVASPPDLFWPTSEAFIPPTPLLRAESHDTRQSTRHPLRHAALNAIRHIAALRTQPPFSEMQPTRNGADYLLTSLSLFITHEPCVMCCMALLHSRVREVFYIVPRKRGGGFDNAFGVHGRKDLNHRFEAWRWEGAVPRVLREGQRGESGASGEGVGEGEGESVQGLDAGSTRKDEGGAPGGLEMERNTLLEELRIDEHIAI